MELLNAQWGWLDRHADDADQGKYEKGLQVFVTTLMDYEQAIDRELGSTARQRLDAAWEAWNAAG